MTAGISWPTQQQTPWSRVLLEKITFSQLVKKFSTFYRTRKFITVFQRKWHLSPPRARSIQSTPSHFIFEIHCNIILPLKLRSSIWSLSSFQAKFRYTFLFCPMCATRTSHGIFLDLMTAVVVRGDNYEAFHFAIFAIPLLLLPS